MYQFRVQRTDGSPADPPNFRSSTLNWRQGDKIPLTAERTLRFLGVRDDDAEKPPALVVEDLPDRAVATAPDVLLGSKWPAGGGKRRGARPAAGPVATPRRQGTGQTFSSL